MANATTIPPDLPNYRQRVRRRMRLHKRLRFLSAVFGSLYLVTFLIFLGRVAVSYDAWPTGMRGVSLWSYGIVFVLATVLWTKLYLSRPGTLNRLRWYEAVLFGALCLRLLLRSVVILFDNVRVIPDDAVGAVGQALSTGQLVGRIYQVTMPWALYAMVYGICVPNSTRRRTLVLSAMFLTPLAVLATAFAAGTVPWPIWTLELATHGLILPFFAAALPILYAARRYDRLEKETDTLREEVDRANQYVKKHKLMTEGGMGTICLAEHPRLKRQYVIKTIRATTFAADQDAKERFMREARCTAELTHPSVVHVYDCDFDASDGMPYYTMEFLPGLDLDKVARKAPLSPQRVIHILRQLCGALREAAQKDLVHRDIKPNNIRLCRYRGGLHDRAVLIDFGLVRDNTPGAYRSMDTDAIRGSAAYLSREQVCEQPATHRSDIYALGAVAYFLLTGRRPYQDREGRWEILMAIHEESPIGPPLQDYLPDNCLQLAQVINGCLSPKPELRPTSATELDMSLAECQYAIGSWSEADAEAWWTLHGVVEGETRAC